jgi:predicted metalloprotease
MHNTPFPVRRVAVAIVATFFVVTSCGSQQSRSVSSVALPATTPAATTTVPTTTATTTAPTTTVPATTVPATTAPTTTSAPTYGPNDDNQVITEAVAEVSDYWVTEYPLLYPGGTYAPIDPSRLYPYGPSDPPPACGSPGLADYQQVAGNAFYCPANDSVSWDHVALTPKLLADFGPLTLAIVIAHELGHRTQALHGILDGRFATFVTEQQADCFAGAWTSHVKTEGSSHFQVDGAALDSALAGFLTFRDPIGTSPQTDPNAHGSAFQRIKAFEDGYTQGASMCATYEQGALDSASVPDTFNSSVDASSGGNLPFAEVEPLVIKNLDGFWSAAFSAENAVWTDPQTDPYDASTGVTCGSTTLTGSSATDRHFYCAADDTIAWDESTLMPTIYNSIGDMGVGSVIATDFAERAQHDLGRPTDTAAAQLQRDCLTGVWAGMTANGQLASSLPTDAQITLSPGDLDEVVSAFLRFNTTGIDARPAAASAFERIGSFQNGFFQAYDNGLDVGLTSCLSA